MLISGAILFFWSEVYREGTVITLNRPYFNRKITCKKVLHLVGRKHRQLWIAADLLP